MPIRLAECSLRQLVSFSITAFAIVWATQIYGVVGNHPVLAWLYIPFLALCSFRLTVFVIAYVVAFIANEAAGVGLPIAEIGLGAQATLIVYWALRGKLLRRPLDGSSAARAYQWLLGAVRPCFIVIAVLLACGLLFRNTPAVECVLWPICLMAVASSIPRQPIRWRFALATTALTLVSIAAGLAVIEFGARLLLPPVPVIPRPGRGAFEADPDCLWTLKPNTKVEHSTTPAEGGEPKKFWVEISSQGIRDREFGPKEPGEFRIALVGDSLAMGWGLAVEKAPPRALERALRARGLDREVSVINMGVAGFGPWQERHFFLKRGLPLEPDLVVLELYPENDVHNTLTRVGKYLQCYDKGWEDIVVYWRFQADWRMQAEWWLREHSRLYHQFALATNSSVDVNTLLRNVRFLGPVRMPKLPPQGPRLSFLEFMLEDWYPDLEMAWTMTQDDVREFENDCRTRNIGFVGYCLPSWTEVFASSWNRERAKAGGVRYERFKDVRLCERFYRSEGIPYVNVADALAKDGGNEGAYLNDGHLSELGSAILAEIVADFLVTEVLPNYGIHRTDSGASSEREKR